MIKVFVVDDEPLILRTIKQMIEQTHSGFKVVGEVLDGQKALSGIERLKPDVVFTDIRMPVMDGLTLVTKLREQNSNIITVVLSGYQEFEYAHKALKLGVFDYLLKPLSLEALRSLLNNIFENFEAKLLDQQMETMQKVIINSSSALKSENNSLQQLFNFSEYNYMLICAGSFCTFSCLWITPAKDFWIKNDLKSLAMKYITAKNSCWVLDGENSNEKIIICGINDDIHINTKNILEQIHNDLVSYGFPITSVTGHVSDIHHIGSAIQKSRITLNKNIYFAKSSFIVDKDRPEIQQNEDSSLLNINTEKTLNLLIQNLQSEKLKQELLKLFNLFEKKSYRQLNLERFIKYLLTLFYMSFSSISNSKAVEIDLEINELLSNSNSYKSLYEGICFIVDDLFQMKSTKFKMDDSQKYLIDKIEQYIKSNFCKQINLQTLSEIFGLVPPYLSRIFKKVKGISPTDYIVSLRIEKAKELLLMEPHIVLKDIAETVGFNDRFYFSKVFKSVTGKTPSEFRAG